MSRLARIAVVAVALLVPAGALSAPPAHHKPRAVKPAAPPLLVLDVPEATRLLLIAPHPDDEVLGAGGLMQRVRATGGAVRVVYLTDGDGYPKASRKRTKSRRRRPRTISATANSAGARRARPW